MSMLFNPSLHNWAKNDNAKSPNIVKTPFEAVWPSFWFDEIPDDAVFTSFQVTGDSQPGFHVADAWRFSVDVNYEISAYESDATEDVIEPLGWQPRAGGSNVLRTFKVPNGLIIPDATEGNTPNNPAIVLNYNTKEALWLNACTRIVAGGPIIGYIAKIDNVAVPGNHGGSYLGGGYLTLKKLNSGNINHQVAFNCDTRKYLHNGAGGFIAPALHADDGYDDPESNNYYGGNITILKMGSLFAIPSGVTAQGLGISTAYGLAIFKAAKKHGFRVVDNTGWDNLALNATPEAEAALNDSAVKTDLALIYSVLQHVA